jgi:hypothetical protein
MPEEPEPATSEVAEPAAAAPVIDPATVTDPEAPIEPGGFLTDKRNRDAVGPFKKPCALEGVDKPFRPSLFRHAVVNTLLNPRDVLPEEVYAIVHAPPSDTADGLRARAVLALFAEGVCAAHLLEARLMHFKPDAFALDFRNPANDTKPFPDTLVYPLSPETVRIVRAHLTAVRAAFVQAGRSLSEFTPLFPGSRDGLPIVDSTLKRICDKWLNGTERPGSSVRLPGVHPKRLRQMYALNVIEKPLKDTAILCAREVLYQKLRKAADNRFTADVGKTLFRWIWEEDEPQIKYWFTDLDEARNLWFLSGGWYEFMPAPNTLIWYPAEAWKGQFFPWYFHQVKRDDGAPPVVTGDPFAEE